MNWFTQPLGLWAFAALPVVLALHLYRRRYQDQAVAALFLWEDLQMAESSGRRRQPLRRTASFWLEMLAALLAALLLSGFDPLRQGEAQHVVVVLDSSASMSAATASASGSATESIAEQARQIVREALDQSGRRTRVTLVQSGVRPQLLCGPAALQPDGLRALESWLPSAPHHDLDASILLARELSAGSTILVVTDQLPDQAASTDDVNWQACGIPMQNVGFSSLARVRLDDGEEEIALSVRSFADAPTSTEWTASSAGQTLKREQIDLQPNQQRKLSFTVSAGTGRIDLSLGDDALELDNKASLLPPIDRTVRVVYRLEEATEQTLRMSELLRALPGVMRSASTSEAHLVFAHEHTSGLAWSVRLPKESGQRDQAEAYIAGFLPEKRHPLMTGLTFEGLLWTRDTAFVSAGLPVLAVGDIPLLSETLRDHHVAIDLNLLPARSTIARSPDWPILVSNLVEWRRDQLPGPRSVNLIAGEAFVLRRQGDHRYSLASDALRRDGMIASDVLYVDDLPPNLQYTLTAEDDEQTEFAVNFVDLSESDLRDRETNEASATKEQSSEAADRFAESPTARILLVLLLLAIALDWLVLRGRVDT